MFAPAAFLRHGAIPDPKDLDGRGGETGGMGAPAAADIGQRKNRLKEVLTAVDIYERWCEN